MPAPFRIAFLVNRYPAVSHSFVRREILALEAAGVRVRRLSIRASDEALPDAKDRTERDRTTVILACGAFSLLADMVLVALGRPFKTLSAFRIAMRSVPLSAREWVRRCAYVAEACAIVRMFRLAPVDHLHAHFGTNPAMVARLVHHLGGPPFSFTAHGPDEFDRPIDLDLRGKIASARLTVGVSSFGRSQLMRWSDPRHWSRIAVVRCGVDEGFLDPAAQARKTKLSIALDGDLPDVLADERALFQIVLNLVSNAVRYGREGGLVEISAKRSRLHGLEITVADDGPGIPAEYLDKVMEPFVRVGGEANRNVEGSGLGLPIVKKLMELHGGSFILESTVGAGTTARLRLPADRLLPRADTELGQPSAAA